MSALEVTARGIRLSNDPEVPRRHEVAQELARAGRYDDALTEYTWVWTHDELFRVLDDRELRVLVRAHPPTRAAVELLRDRCAPPTEQSLDVDDFREWDGLNRILGEGTRTLAWFDTYGDRFDRPELFVDFVIVPGLVADEQWQEALLTNARAIVRALKAAERLADAELLEKRMCELKVS